MCDLWSMFRHFTRGHSITFKANANWWAEEELVGMFENSSRWADCIDGNDSRFSVSFDKITLKTWSIDREFRRVFACTKISISKKTKNKNQNGPQYFIYSSIINSARTVSVTPNYTKKWCIHFCSFFLNFMSKMHEAYDNGFYFMRYFFFSFIFSFFSFLTTQFH